MAEEFPEVAGFLAALDHSQRERFLGECEGRESPFHIWLYACAMGYEGGFVQLDTWLQKRYPQINRRQVLMGEAAKLEADIELARIPAEGSKPGDVARSVAALSKELRGHLAEIERMTRAVDRRGLILSGADRLLRILQDMFADDPEMLSALGQGFEALWAQVGEER